MIRNLHFRNCDEILYIREIKGVNKNFFFVKKMM